MSEELLECTPELLREKAGNVRSYKSEHDEVMAKFKDLMYGLREHFEGEAYDAFIQRYEEMQPKFQAFSRALQTDYADQMDVSANKIEEADRKLKGMIG